MLQKTKYGPCGLGHPAVEGSRLHDGPMVQWAFPRENLRQRSPLDGPRLLAQQTKENRTITYADAGVDIERSNRTKQRIKYLAHKTFNRGVLSDIGGFGGLFSIDKKKYLDPVLVSSVDGVGTKLKIAFEMNLHAFILV